MKEPVPSYRVCHMRARSYYAPRPICGRYSNAFFLTDQVADVTCLRCLRRMEATAEVLAAWARAMRRGF